MIDHLPAQRARIEVILLIVMMVAVLCGIPVADAQQAGEPTSRQLVIPTVYVTAQKEEQRLQDVAISMTVLDGEFLAAHHIDDLENLGAFVPNARISFKGSTSTNDVRLRGFGSTIVNKAFEQPAGLVRDGVPFNRQPYFFSTLFDVERLEVLRGPQGTLVGKNTTAGAFNVTTRNPSDEFTGDLKLEFGERNRRHVDAAIGGPAIPGVMNFRIAAVTHEEDGYMRNTMAAVLPTVERLGPTEDRKAIRAKAEFPDIAGASLLFTYERVNTDQTGSAAEPRLVTPSFGAFQSLVDPNFDTVPFNNITSDNPSNRGQIDIETFQIDLQRDFGEWEWNLLANRSTLDDLRESSNPTAVSEFRLFGGDENPSTTVEIRAQSPDFVNVLPFGLEHSIDFQAGFFFQRRELDSVQDVLFSLAGFGLSAKATFGILPPPGFPVLAVTSTLDNRLLTFYDQTSDSYAGFTHITLDLDEVATLEVGMRLTHEKKKGRWNLTTVGPLPLSITGFEGGFTAQERVSETFFTPKVSVRRDVTEDVTVYAFWAKGVKSGGLNEFALQSAAAADDYDAEKTTDYEAGAKMTLLDGAANLNIGFFWQEVTDFQVVQTIVFPPIVIVTNAGKARSRGVEIDGEWLVTDWLSVVVAAAWIDAEYVDFPFGGCQSDRRDSDGDGDPACDLSGQRIDRTPEWTATLVPSLTVPVTSVLPPAVLSQWGGWASDLDLLGSAVVQYEDAHETALSLDHRSHQDSYFWVDATLGIGNVRGGSWSVGVTGQNLTDADVATYTADTPTGGGNLWHAVKPPRAFFGWLRYSF